MGKLSKPLCYVCRSCGTKCETFNTGNRGIYCSKKCRADFERKGEAHPRRYRQDGHWMLSWTIPGGTKRKQNRRFEFEHVRVWREQRGELPAGHIIHHINGDGFDNRIENLQPMRRGDHCRLHAAQGDLKRSDETRAKISAARRRHESEKRALA